MDDVVEEEAPAGQEVADGGGWGFVAGAERLWRPGISNGKKEVMGGWDDDLGTRLSKM